MAGIMGISTQHLRTLCKNQLGELPSRRLRRLRLQIAAGLLMKRDFSLRKIGQKVGYDDPFALSRAFSRFHGVSPQRFRNKHRKH